MQKKVAPRVSRLIYGLKALTESKNSYKCSTNGIEYQCTIEELWHKKLSSLNRLSTPEISELFQYYTVLYDEQLGKKSCYIVFSSGCYLVIKVATINDFRKLDKIVDQYVKYLLDSPKSLIARIVRAFSVRSYNYDINDCFLIMESFRPRYLHTAYDIKGFIEGRSILEDESVPNEYFGKDQELMASKNMVVLKNSKETVKPILYRLLADIKFLQDYALMDYSLLIVFSSVANCSANCFKLSDGNFCTMGIIDFLQYYNALKKMEGAFKSLFKQTQAISSVDSQAYAKRLKDFLEKELN